MLDFIVMQISEVNSERLLYSNGSSIINYLCSMPIFSSLLREKHKKGVCDISVEGRFPASLTIGYVLYCSCEVKVNKKGFLLNCKSLL